MRYLSRGVGLDLVAPLLPATAECLVLVTSRRFLGDLPAAVAELPLDIRRPDDGSPARYKHFGS
jgi:hypothetical protein